MIAGRDSRGHFTKGNVPWSKRVDGRQREVTTFVGRKLIGGGLLKLEPVQVICPACGEQVEVVARDGRVKGYCAVARRYVDFLIETQGVPAGKHLTAETRAKISAAHMGKHRQHAAETIVKISSALMGKHLTAETKAKISAAKKGKPLTPEHRAKISAVLKGRHNKKESE